MHVFGQDVSGHQVVVDLQGVHVLGVSEVGGSHVLVLRSERLGLLHFPSVVAVVVVSREDAVVGHLVVVAGGLEVVQVAEGGGVHWGQVLDLV